MEPMAVGSSPSTPTSPLTNPGYLPSFLLGDAQPVQGTPSSPVSPVGNKSLLYKRGLNVNEPINLRQKLFSPVDTNFDHTVKKITTDKIGPPKQGLFDTVLSVKGPNTPRNYTESPSNLSTMGNTSYNQSYLNESGNHSFFDSTSTSSRREHRNTLWITIFGFPPSSASLVLAQFAQCGTVVDKKFPTQGNWVNLKYSAPSEVTRALGFNGKLIANCIMVGVLPYHNKQESKENIGSFTYTSPIRARSLRQSFVSPQNSNTVLPSDSVPQKSTGIVTKAMEYVFGW